jgi:hypothetical protein
MSAGRQLDHPAVNLEGELTSQTSLFNFSRPIIGLTELDYSLEIDQSDVLDDNLPFPLFIL